MQYLVATAIVLASLQTLKPARLTGTAVHSIRIRYVTAVGIMTGCGLAVSGPLILLPIALTVGVVAHVGLSQFVQIPIGTFATIGNLSVPAMPMNPCDLYQKCSNMAPFTISGCKGMGKSS